jgi:hypothetical protein
MTPNSGKLEMQLPRQRHYEIAAVGQASKRDCFQAVRLGLGTTLIALLAFCGSSSAHAETSYWRLTTDRITVVSNGSARRCNKLATQFIAFERLLRDLADFDADFEFPPLAVYSLSEADARRVFLSADDKREQSASDMRIFSKYLPGRDVNVAAIVDIDGGDQALQSLLLLYAQSMVASGPTRVFPVWYQIGVPNITNGLIIRDDGSVLLSRNIPFEPIADKRARTTYNLAALLATTGQEFASGDVREFSKRAREWAQFGLLTTPERRNQYFELATFMRQGAPAEEAVQQAFGVPLAQLAEEFEDGKWRKQVNFKIPAPSDPVTVPVAERIDAAQANNLLQLIADRVAQQPLRR